MILLVLKNSRVHGVGVFTTRKIAAHRHLPLFDERDWRWLANCPKHEGQRLCVRGDGGFYGPKNWHRPSVGWYLNHSDTPNVCAKTWRTLRAVRLGEELTISYLELGEEKP